MVLEIWGDKLSAVEKLLYLYVNEREGEVITLPEFANDCNLAKSTVQKYVRELLDKRVIKRTTEDDGTYRYYVRGHNGR